jgi:hypothetical protein
MDITRDPIFKSIMFALAVMYVALATNSAWAAKGGKPPSEPVPVIAEDVVCDGCVDTGDIADGAVTYTPRDSTGCHYADGTLAAFEILPNDPAITGVPTEGYAGPIRISIANQ